MKPTRKQIEKMIADVAVTNEAELFASGQTVTRMINQLHNLTPLGLLDGGDEPSAEVQKDVAELYVRWSRSAVRSLLMFEKESSDIEVTFNFRVPQSLRDDFNSACDAMDTTSAQSIRQHMRSVVGQHKNAGK